MKLSVIIPCLNAEATLPVQLEALANQVWSEPWEVIVADNGSTDGSKNVIHQYQGKLPSLRVVNASEKRGSAHARNAGVKAARSEALAFCDADDEVGPEWVALMGEALSKHDVVYGQFHFDKFNDPQRAAVAARAWEGGLYKGRFLPGGGTGNLGVRRSVHEAIGEFDEHLLRNSDADYYWRLVLEGFELHYVPAAAVQVRIARTNPTPAYFFRRARNRATSNYWLYKRYKHLGMSPPQPVKRSLVTWINQLTRAHRFIASGRKRRAWLELFSTSSGDLIGQIQGRLTNPCKAYNPGTINQSQENRKGHTTKATDY